MGASGGKIVKLKLKTFSGEEIHKVEEVEGDQTEEKDKEKAEDEGWGANNHIHFDRFLWEGLGGSNKLEGANCRIEEELVKVSSCMIN